MTQSQANTARNADAAAQVLLDQATAATPLRPDLDDDEYAVDEGFSALSMTGKIAAGVGIATLAGAAGYGVFKGTAAVMGAEALVAGEGAMAAGLLSGASLTAAAPFVAAGAIAAGVGYGAYKAVDYLTRDKKKIVARTPRQATPKQTADAWPLPPMQQAA